MHPYNPRSLQKGWINSIDPRTKLTWMVFLIILASTTKDPPVLAALILLIILTSVATGLSVKKFFYPLVALALVFIQIFLASLLFNHQGAVIAHWGPLNLHASTLPVTILVSLRLGGIIFALMQFMQWTAAEAMVLMLIKAKIPYRFAMLVGLALRFLPLMEKELSTIMESQSTRGLAMENAWQKLKNLVPVTLPFLYRAFRRANETALAMELRGFGYAQQRTFSQELRLTRTQAGSILLMLILAGWQIYTLTLSNYLF